MIYKLVLVDKQELHAGEKEEAGEHHLTSDDAESVSAQHLDKHSHYYSDLEKAGLNESLESIKSAALSLIKPIEKNEEAKAEAKRLSSMLSKTTPTLSSIKSLSKGAKFGIYSISAGLAYAAWAQRDNPYEAMQLLKTAKEIATMAMRNRQGGASLSQAVPDMAQGALEIAKDAFLGEEIETGPHFPFSDKKVVGKGRLGRKMKHPSTTVGSSLPVSGPR